MDQKYNHLKRARDFARQQLYAEALSIFEPLYKSVPENFSKWDLYYYAKSLSKQQQEKKAFLISKNLYNRDPNMDFNKTLYMWLIYNLYIKPDVQQHDQQEQLLFRAAKYIVDNTSQEAYSPYEKTVFRIIQHIKGKANQDYKKMLEWLEYLDVTKLSSEPRQFVDSEGKARENASPLEQWYATRVKALYKTKQYALCIEAADQALVVIPKFHYDNDIWIREKKAVSKFLLGRINEALAELKQLVKEKAHSLIFYDIFKVQRALGEMNEALIAGASGLLDKNGELHHKLSLLNDMADLLIEIGDYEKAYAHLSLINEVRRENGWNPLTEVDAKLKKLSQMVAIQTYSSRKQLVIYWKKLVLNSLSKGKGIVKTIFPNGKAGFIQTEDGQDIYFKMSNVLLNRKHLKKQAIVEFYKKESFDRIKKAESVEAIEIRVLNE